MTNMDKSGDGGVILYTFIRHKLRLKKMLVLDLTFSVLIIIEEKLKQRKQWSNYKAKIHLE
jgi:hypothetical protein